MTLATNLINYGSHLAATLTLMGWKEALARRLQIKRAPELCGEDFLCFCCCPCYAISAVENTVNSLNPTHGQQPGMVMTPGGLVFLQQQQGQRIDPSTGRPVNFAPVN